MNNEAATQFIEEGAASMEIVGRARRLETPKRERLDVVVIGGGQAGLSAGYHLQRAGARFVILDANPRIGDAWRNRWDSLRLFTPAKFDSLDGMAFPASGNYFPTKDEMADYLEQYAQRFELPVRTNMRVERLFKRGGRYVARAGAFEFEADHAIVAMAKYQRMKLPPFAGGLSSEIAQLHSSAYRNLRQLRPGPVLLVGFGNSGADIALEAARGGHRAWLAGPDTGELPFRPEGFLGRNLFMPLVLGIVFRHVLTVNTPIGRRARPSIVAKGAPRIRVKAVDLAAAGVERTPRVVGVQDGLPLLEDGRTLPAANVIWCNGYRPGLDWIDLPIFDEHGEPKHRSGVVEDQPGLYFLGLPFLHSMSSSMIQGVGRDAARIVAAMALRQSIAVAG